MPRPKKEVKVPELPKVHLTGPKSKPRSSERIPLMLNELHKIWERHPDLRLTQLIINCVPEFQLYPMEDEILIEKMRNYYNTEK